MAREEDDGAESEDERALDHVIVLLRERLGLDFSPYKRGTLRRRFGHVVARGATTKAAYRAQLENDDGRELAQLATAFLVKTTALVRHERAYELLRTQVLPTLLSARLDAGARQVRAWVAACSTGEEAFGLAMALFEARERARAPIDGVVIASDIDPSAIARARLGSLSPHNLGSLPTALRERFLTRGADAFHVAPEIVSSVTFSIHDLLAGATAPKEAILATFDLVSCCNVLIYLEAEARDRVFRRLLQTCRPGGFLVLGEAESPPAWCQGRLELLEKGVPVFRVR